MMKILSTAAAALAFMASQTASAQTFATTPGTYTFAGSGVLVQKGSGPLLSCDLSVTIVNNGSTITATPSLTGFFGFCDTVVFTGAPYNVVVSGSNVTLQSVYADTTITPGDCAGDITASWAGGSPETLTVNTTLPAVSSGTGDCTISGVISW
jgi:hypothetical protein